MKMPIWVSNVSVVEKKSIMLMLEHSLKKAVGNTAVTTTNQTQALPFVSLNAGRAQTMTMSADAVTQPQR